MARVTHFEIPALNPKKSVDFYTKVFDWKIQQWGNEEYWLAETGDKNEMGINGAITPKKDIYQSVINTIGVKNLDMVIEKIRMHGGQVITEKQEIPKVGTLVYFKDPDGNILGAIQPSPDAMM